MKVKTILLSAICAICLIETINALPGQGQFYVSEPDECVYYCPDGAVYTPINNCFANYYSYCTRAKCLTYSQICY
jgi:hypothetical protein